MIRIGKERSECGRVKGMQNNPCKKPGATESFTKFTTNAKSDPYVDPGKFNAQLRGTPKRPQSAQPSFKLAHPSARKVKHSEFDHRDGKDPHGNNSLKPFCNRPSGFYNRKTAEPFTNQNGIGYSEDPYERNQDLNRDETARLNSAILYKNQPFSEVVKQHGTFYPHKMTYGTSKQFAEKPKSPKFVPKYGVYKRGDLSHTGYNKTFGGHNGRSTEYDYHEEQEQDPVKYQRDVRNPIWRTTNQMSKSMANVTMVNHYRNVNQMRELGKI